MEMSSAWPALLTHQHDGVTVRVETLWDCWTPSEDISFGPNAGGIPCEVSYLDTQY